MDSKGGSKTVNPNDIRFSQSSVNGSAEIVESMRNNGWNYLILTKYIQIFSIQLLL